MAKTFPGLTFERRWWREGRRWVAGLDEVGRGAWAGPVVAAAVILPPEQPALRAALKGVTDSKLCTARQRERLFHDIYRVALSVGVGGAGAGEVDHDGLLVATRAAMQRAVAMLNPQPEALLVDAVDLRAQVPLPQHWPIHGELRSLSIAAASIIAKVYRDRWMEGLDLRCPGYGFAQHKGYGTVQHIAALARLGPCEFHRLSYAPVMRLIGQADTLTPMV
jgi:ribonuclease HII